MRYLLFFIVIIVHLLTAEQDSCRIDDEHEAQDFGIFYAKCWDKSKIENKFPLVFSNLKDEDKLTLFLENKEEIEGGVVMNHSCTIARLKFPALKVLGSGNGNVALEIYGNRILKELSFTRNTVFEGIVRVRGNRYLNQKSINRLKNLVGDMPCDLQEVDEFFCYSTDIMDDFIKGCMVVLGDFIFDEKTPLTEAHEESFLSVRAIKGKVWVTSSKILDIQLLAHVENITTNGEGPAIRIAEIEGIQNVNLSRLHHVSSGGKLIEIKNYTMPRDQFDQLTERLWKGKGLDVEVGERTTTRRPPSEVRFINSTKALVGMCVGTTGLIILCLVVYICIATRKENKRRKREERKAAEEEPAIEE